MTIQGLEQIRSDWDAIAPGYDQFVTPAGGMRLAEEALQRAGLRKGMRFLDVACGSGALSLPAARLGTQVTAVDLSPVMIERLQARARSEGLANIDARVMDGHALELEDATFDVAGSQFGVMLFPDLPRGLAELARVTRPGGKVMMVAYGAPQTIEFLGFFLGALQTVVPGFTGLPDDPPPLPFQVADPTVLERRMTEASVKDVRIEVTSEDLEFRSGKEFWSWLTNSNPVGARLVADLNREQVAEVQQVLNGMLRERAGGNGVAVLHNLVHVAIGTK